jgi:hypothetical protein
MKVEILKHPSIFWAPFLDLYKKNLVFNGSKYIEFGSLFHQKFLVLGQNHIFQIKDVKYMPKRSITACSRL